MKQRLKYSIYLKAEDYSRLKQKAEELNLISRGAVSRLIEKFAREKVIWLDENVMSLLNSLNIKAEEKD